MQSEESMKMENKLKYLEFLQNVITRMNSNSFLIKGWTITLVSALFALAAKDANPKFAMISYIVIPIFWMLDGYYLSIERQYRALYCRVALVKKDEDIDFCMNASGYNTEDRTWVRASFSETLLPFYGVLLFVVVVVMLFVSNK